MDNDESLADELRQHLYEFLEAQYRVLIREPFAVGLELERHKQAYFSSQYKFFVKTRCTGILHYASRAFLFATLSFEDLAELKHELATAYPDLDLTAEELQALEIYTRAAAVEFERLTLLAVLWRM